MIGERVALGAAAGESRDGRRPGGRLFRRQFVFRGAGFELLEFERQLVDQPRRALRPLPVDLALELGDPSFCAAISAMSSEAFARATASSAATSRRLARQRSAPPSGRRRRREEPRDRHP